MSKDFRKQALKYHQFPKPGKISVTPIKSMSNQRDLALAYSPGVAYACEEIEQNEETASLYTSRANLVAVITNGTAVLGLGNIGPLASKPVMEGKGVLFKKFADIDVFDIEVDELDVDKFVDIVASLEPTFGGINLEDLKAPECFEIEKRLKERMGIPVFHDDQHGTAIIATAALLNAIGIQGKSVGEIKVAVSGAGAAGMACLDLFVDLGVLKENISVCDSKGVIYVGREGADQGRKKDYAIETKHRTLADVVNNADVFLGVSQPGVLTGEMVKTMADNPLVLALANPVPEIMPEIAKEARSDVMVATGRSDYPNQVNNVLCFPYIFRGALDVGATEINQEMKLACVKAIADLAKSPVDETVTSAYGRKLKFGREYIIPTPFDPRLIEVIPAAVAKAAMKTGVAKRPIKDMQAYQESLKLTQNKSGMVMRPVFESAKANPKKIVFAEGEEDRVLFAAKAIMEEGLAKPILIGRPKRINEKIQKLGIDLSLEEVEVINPLKNKYYEQCVDFYHKKLARKGIDPEIARVHMNTKRTALAAVLVDLGIADTMICGLLGRFDSHFESLNNIFSNEENICAATISMMITPKGTVFISDTHITENPTVDELVNIAELCVESTRKFNVQPKVAMLSHSSFGAKRGMPNVDKMAEARDILKEKYPELMVEGEMKADAALSVRVRASVFPENELKGHANILVMPNLDAANISFNLMKVSADGVTIGPIMMGLSKPAHILSRTSTVRRIINMSAIAVVDAQEFETKGTSQC